jgi:hypothetical protein
VLGCKQDRKMFRALGFGASETRPLVDISRFKNILNQLPSSAPTPQTTTPKRKQSQTAIMSSEKRPASDDFSGSQMVVKRQNVGRDSKAVALSNGSAGNGALIQSVCISSHKRELCAKLHAKALG